MLYFFPIFIAGMRRHPYAGAIFVVNLFLGWTLLGWVVSLAWAVFPIQRPARQQAALVAPAAATIVATRRKHVSALDKLCPVEKTKWEAIDDEA